MTRRFNPGDNGRIGEFEWRVVQGKKAPDDRRLEIRALEFYAVPMALGALFADFFSENEDVLYPPEKGYAGGRRYMHFLAGAISQGWEIARDQLELERRLAADRRAA